MSNLSRKSVSGHDLTATKKPKQRKGQKGSSENLPRTGVELGQELLRGLEKTLRTQEPRSATQDDAA